MSLPQSATRFADYRGRHRGKALVVCGCGASLKQLHRPEQFVTIGVNDVGRLFTPDYLVVVNERRQFTPERYVYVEQSQAKAIFSQLELAHPRAVRFKLGRRGGTDQPDADTLHYANNSPYVAVNLARHMGAARIGLIGVDFGDDHFFGATGRHPLAGQLPQIDREYAALAATCRTEGVTLVNLSPMSGLRSLPRMSIEDWASVGRPVGRVFFVHYRFLSCGTVFETGLRGAARTLGLTGEHAYWDDPELPAKVERFAPDLLFVVHGRRFVQRWGRRFNAWRSAVWLLDEPYEVDDTSAWSNHFDHVFVNDAASLGRHRNAHLLPVAFAPALHFPGKTAPTRRVGFVGGANPSRERLLAGLASKGLLDYVVGGPWHDVRLKALCLAANIPAEQAAALYRETAIVINVFRDRHHFNREGLKALAPNPRVFEALACGALVISEPREQLLQLVPELPTFSSEAEAVRLIERYLAQPDELERVQRACAARLADATYERRLAMVIDALDLNTSQIPAPTPAPSLEPVRAPGSAAARTGNSGPMLYGDEVWGDLGGVTRKAADGAIVVEPGPERGPGRERGLASFARLGAAHLCFEVRLDLGACLVAKLNLAERTNPSSNSYHLFADQQRAYLARHNHVFRYFEGLGTGWTRFRIARAAGRVSLWRDQRLVCEVDDHLLADGYAFVGAQGGSVRVRGLELTSSPPGAVADSALPDSGVDELVAVATDTPPRLSIVTTVYDRVDCLRRCIASVRKLRYGRFEHLIVADHPPESILEQVRTLVEATGDARIGLYNLKRRHNNWGITPAAAGLRRARGEFVSFLSDDNGYAPDHFGPLLAELDRDPGLGFAYSSCLYDGRLVLRAPVPRPGAIDLGQPLFRRALFPQYLGNDLPFDTMAWDWHLVEALMKRGVHWRHVNRPSFIFRLAKYPELIVA